MLIGFMIDKEMLMSWGEFIGIHALIGVLVAWLTIRWRMRFALPFAIMVLWFIPYIWYWSSAQNADNTDELSAWSPLFIAPAWLVACLVFGTVRLGCFLRNRK
ncbi:hypothetical protein [Alysiella crassa]|nr:hypothetical protein [Alysiella crassa]UOP06001.1 hypothetical protein LVJ80_09060 [Alysiella crassa]